MIALAERLVEERRLAWVSGRDCIKKRIVSMGTRITSIGDLIGKATPIERHGSRKGMVKLR
jgi:hypothetical protein